MRLLMLSLWLIIITGCSSFDADDYYPLTYDSSPQGASVICDGAVKGYTPLKLWHKINMRDTSNSSINLGNCIAKWASGATTRYDTNWDLQKYPKSGLHLAQRPDVEGYQVDAEFALKVKQLEYTKQQAAAARQQAKATEKISKKKRTIVIKDDGIIKRCRMGGTC